MHKERAIYKYKGCLYTVIREATMKNPYSREWEACTIYVSSETGQTYVRQTKDFLDKFEKMYE